MKARIGIIGLFVLCSACAAPSLRYKNDVAKLAAEGQFKVASQYVTKKKNKMYSKRDAVLFYLDQGALAHDAKENKESDSSFAMAQQEIQNKQAASVTGETGRLIINDLTTSYKVPSFEQAFTYYYRGLNFLLQGNVASAAVEARKAVFFLDHLRGSKESGINDEPFIQYFASLVFESAGELSDARIARQNAFNAYSRFASKLRLEVPSFQVPSYADKLGEIIIIHANGLMPLKTTQTRQVAWNRAVLLASSPAETGLTPAPEVENALTGAFVGSALTLSFPAFTELSYTIKSSAVSVDGEYPRPTRKMADLSRMAQWDLDEKMPSILFRSATRAVVKYVASVQAREAAQSAAENSFAGDLAQMFVSFLGALTEKADTRQWFTLPAEIYMSRVFVAPGKHRIRLLFRNGNGNIVGEYDFGEVTVRKGERIYLQHRTAQ